MIREHTVSAADGRVLRAFDAGAEGGFAVVWHHGSPQSGAPLAPLLTATAERGLRLVTYGRPSYGGSTPAPGRSVASAAADLAAVMDALGIERCATLGASGGGPHALACAALLPARVSGVACLAGMAPYTGEPAWWSGMRDPGGLRAALEGREARLRHEETAEFDEESFTPGDWAALAGEWEALGEDAQTAGEAWPDGLVDDDVAFVTPWGFELREVWAPTLVIHGGSDRVVPPHHGRALAAGCPEAELRERPEDGHISILGEVPAALDWLAARA